MYSDSMYNGETKNKNSIVNKRILNEIKEKVKESLLLYGGRKLAVRLAGYSKANIDNSVPNNNTNGIGDSVQEDVLR